MARQTSSHHIPGIWQGLKWARLPGAQGGGTSRRRLVWRTLRATISHSKALQRWMALVFDLHSRKIVRDLPNEYLRATRPYVHRHTDYPERIVQLIDHMDWFEGAFQSAAFQTIASGKPLVLAELSTPRGFDYIRVQLQQSPAQSMEGELLLTLNLQRSSDVQHNSQPVEAGVLAFSVFRIDNLGCLAIGGVRGQRHATQRLSPVEMSQALQGWKPAVLLVRIAQELARYWSLHLVGLDPAAHLLRGKSYQMYQRYRDGAEKIFASYDALWEHFEATNGPPGWVIVPLNSDDKLSATALSPEKRERQTRRADYWIRTRNHLRLQFKQLLQKAHREARVSRVTQAMPLEDMQSSESEAVPSRVFESGPGSLI